MNPANDNLVQRSNERMKTYERATVLDLKRQEQRRLTIADWQKALDHITKGQQQ